MFELISSMKEIAIDKFPKITDDWVKNLTRLRKEMATACGDCESSRSLCSPHEKVYHWMCRLGRANVPIRYWSLQIDKTLLKEQDALNFVRNASLNVTEVVKRGLGFSLFGERGRGKTTLTLYFLKTALQAGIPGYFSLMESLMTLIKDSFDSVEDKKRYDAIRNVPVLVIDDLGREHMTNSGFVISRLDELFRWRDSMRLSTCFSSNLEGAEFQARYGNGVVSLLKNTNKVLAVQGEELRPALNEWNEITGGE